MQTKRVHPQEQDDHRQAAHQAAEVDAAVVGQAHLAGAAAGVAVGAAGGVQVLQRSPRQLWVPHPPIARHACVCAHSGLCLIQVRGIAHRVSRPVQSVQWFRPAARTAMQQWSRAM